MPSPPSNDAGLSFLERPEAQGAWGEFLDTCLGTIDRAARRVCGDEDEARDLAADVVERLHRDWPEIVRRYLAGRRSSFRVWLAVVARRAAIDARRARHGRVAVPRAVARLGRTERRLWELVCAGDMALTGAGRTLREEGLFEGPDSELVALHGALMASLPEGVRTPGRRARTDVVETVEPASRGAEPGAEAASTALHRAFRQVLEELGPEERQLVRLYFLEGATAEGVARITGMQRAQDVYEQVKRTLRRLRERVASGGLGPEDAAELLDFDWGGALGEETGS